jgi:chemotaxis methyl-accepting protein methylase
MRWSGFREVRTQVRKRVNKRLQSLQLAGLNDYRDYLQQHIDPQLLNRARMGCYPFSSLKDLPAAWRESAFAASAGRYCLKTLFKRPVSFVEHDKKT